MFESFCGQKYSSMNKRRASWSELVRFPVKKVFKDPATDFWLAIIALLRL